MSNTFKAHKPKPYAGSAVKRVDAAPGCAKPQTAETPGSQGPRSAPLWPKEIDGPSGPEPTRYGDWERNGICSDF